MKGLKEMFDSVFHSEIEYMKPAMISLPISCSGIQKLAKGIAVFKRKDIRKMNDVTTSKILNFRKRKELQR